MRSILFISSALVLSACSMTSGQEFYDSPPTYQQSSSYNNGCGGGSCAPGQSYSVAQNQPSAHHGQSYGSGHHAPQQPSAHAYGSQVQHHQGHGQPPQLRGAYGQPGPRGYKYGTIGAVAYDLDTDIYGIQGRLGYQSANYLGAEVEGSFGVTNETGTIGAIDTELEVDYQVAAFALARLPISERLSVFSRAGYHATRFSAEIDDGVTVLEDSETLDGFAYGVGGEYALNPRDSLRLDYTRYDMSGLSGSTDSMAVSYSRKF